jgi:CDP-diacylglycerol---serine O-phosphatidyltransferase
MKYAPMLLSFCNALMGALAIYFVIQCEYDYALIAIVMGTFFDVFDGKVARMLKLESKRGASADSLSDLMTFGVAPAFIITRTGGYGDRLSSIVAMIFFLALFFRLMRYRFSRPLDKAFFGMPAPMVASLVSALALFGMRYPEYKNLYLIFIVIFSLIAVSKIVFPRYSHPVMIRIPKILWIIVCGGHLLTLPFFPKEVVLSLTLIYTILGPLLMLRYRDQQAAIQAEE